MTGDPSPLRIVDDSTGGLFLLHGHPPAAPPEVSRGSLRLRPVIILSLVGWIVAAIAIVGLTVVLVIGTMPHAPDHPTAIRLPQPAQAAPLVEPRLIAGRSVTTPQRSPVEVAMEKWWLQTQGRRQ